ncbi:LytTR family DNA-binding domain-containing protein [Clostridium sp.]|uniref:LytTR family DNA-binding domain-containing protein n=1 Tax=Clostridium sp. TaxID=1506 RepID=UPI003D6D8498
MSIKQLNNMGKDEIVICCLIENKNINKIKEYAENMDLSMGVFDEKEKVLIYPEEVFYIESVDKKTFVYLERKVVESSLRLYEIEEKYKGLTFFRATKSTIINTRYIRKIVPMLNRNLLVTLKNNDKVTISRRNIKEFKEILGWE